MNNYNQQWDVITMHAQDTALAPKSSNIASLFTSALRQLGYNFDPSTTTSLSRRFGVDSKIDFSNFVHAFEALRVLTNIFKARDPQLTGWITLPYEEYMMIYMHY